MNCDTLQNRGNAHSPNVLDKYIIWGILRMKKYSISEASIVLGVDRTTLRRWVREDKVPAPTPGVVGGILSKFWTEEDMAKLREYKLTTYWGKGLNRRTGKRAKGEKRNAN
jgi:MerR HTH family regulatory protein